MMMIAAPLSRIVLLSWCLAVVVVSVSAATATTTCETETNGDDGSCQAALDDTMTPRVVAPGTKLNDGARFPYLLEGDFERVLATQEIEVMVDSGVAWTEGPLVRPKKQQENPGDDGDDTKAESSSSSVLYFSDTIRAVIYRLSIPDNNADNLLSPPELEVWATHAGGIDPTLPEYSNMAEPGSNGMATDALDPGFVVVNQHGLRRVVRCRLDDHPRGAPLSECPDFDVLATSYAAKPFNAPNDVIVDGDNRGSIWFTDPLYGLLEKDRFCDELSCVTGTSYLEGKSEMGWTGVYRIHRRKTKRKTASKAAAVELITKFHRRPNGLAFGGENTLWVSDSTIGNPSWTAYNMSVAAVEGPRKASLVLNAATLGTTLGHAVGLPPLTGGEGLSDGFKIDEKGYLWASIPNGLAVIDPTSSQVVCQILLGINTSNLAFGDDGDVWITGKGGVWKLKRKISATQQQ